MYQPDTIHALNADKFKVKTEYKAKGTVKSR